MKANGTTRIQRHPRTLRWKASQRIVIGENFELVVIAVDVFTDRLQSVFWLLIRDLDDIADQFDVVSSTE